MNLPTEVLESVVGGALGPDSTVKQELDNIGEELLNAKWKFSSISGSLKKFIGWTPNYVLVLTHYGFFSSLDRFPRNPPKENE